MKFNIAAQSLPLLVASATGALAQEVTSNSDVTFTATDATYSYGSIPSDLNIQNWEMNVGADVKEINYEGDIYAKSFTVQVPGKSSGFDFNYVGGNVNVFNVLTLNGSAATGPVNATLSGTSLAAELNLVGSATDKGKASLNFDELSPIEVAVANFDSVVYAGNSLRPSVAVTNAAFIPEGPFPVQVNLYEDGAVWYGYEGKSYTDAFVDLGDQAGTALVVTDEGAELPGITFYNTEAYIAFDADDFTVTSYNSSYPDEFEGKVGVSDINVSTGSHSYSFSVANTCFDAGSAPIRFETINVDGKDGKVQRKAIVLENPTCNKVF